MHAFCHTAGQEWDICECMVQFGLLLYILQQETITCDAFTATTPVKEKSDVECLTTLGHGILQFVTEQKQILASITRRSTRQPTFPPEAKPAPSGGQGASVGVDLVRLDDDAKHNTFKSLLLEI